MIKNDTMSPQHLNSLYGDVCVSHTIFTEKDLQIKANSLVLNTLKPIP